MADKLELIVVKEQNGILETNIEQLENFVSEKLKEYSPESYLGDADAAEKDRAELNNSKKVLTSARIDLMKRLMKPYEDFETRCKKLEKDIDYASSKLDEIVKAKEKIEKELKRNQIEKIWEEQNFTLFSLDKVFNKKWLNKTVKLCEVENEINEIIKQTYANLKIIENFGEDAETLKALYLETLDISQALARGEELKVNREKIAKEKETRFEREKTDKLLDLQQELNQEKWEQHKEETINDLVHEVLTGQPKPKNETKVSEYVVSIKATSSQLLSLKQWMIDNSIIFTVEEIEF